MLIAPARKKSRELFNQTEEKIYSSWNQVTPASGVPFAKVSCMLLAGAHRSSQKRIQKSKFNWNDEFVPCKRATRPHFSMYSAFIRLPSVWLCGRCALFVTRALFVLLRSSVNLFVCATMIHRGFLFTFRFGRIVPACDDCVWMWIKIFTTTTTTTTMRRITSEQCQIC